MPATSFKWESLFSLTGIVLLGIALSFGSLFIRYIGLESYSVIIDEGEIRSYLSVKADIQSDTLLCEWDDAPTLFVSENVFSPLIYYSHVFPMVACALLAFLIWRRHEGQLMNSLFLVLSVSFIVWCLFDLILWADADPSLIMFFWSAQIYFDLAIYFSAAYLLYIFVQERDVPTRGKYAALVLSAPVVLLAPTALNLGAFDYTNCDREATEGLLWHYTYLVELLVVLAMAVVALRSFTRAHDFARRMQIALFSLGLGLFLLAFSWGNIVGSLSEDWALAQYGLFGMPLFLGIVTYLIVQFQFLEVRVIATTVLVASLWVLLFSVLLLETIETAKPVIAVTLFFFALMGLLLIRSVKREIEQRELIERQEKELEVINKQQENLPHFISHEIKGYLAKSQAAFAGIVQGDYGPATAQLKKMAQGGLSDMRRGADMVADILDASNFRKGSVSYEAKPFDLKIAAESAVKDLLPFAVKRGLNLSFKSDGSAYVMDGDEAKIRRHVLRNLIDNSIRYTPQGSITATLSRSDSTLVFSVKDTGVGIAPEDMGHLFTEGGKGKDSTKINVDSTGYGLYISKQVVEAHHGTISAESEGAGKGSTFTARFTAKN